MDPVITTKILMGALVNGDEALVKCIMEFAQHMVEISPQFENDSAAFEHMLRCNLCFSFVIRTGILMPLEKLWAASKEQGATDHPWAENWSLMKN